MVEPVGLVEPMGLVKQVGLVEPVGLVVPGGLVEPVFKVLLENRGACESREPMGLVE